MGQLNRFQQTNSPVSLTVMNFALRHPWLRCASPYRWTSGNVNWKFMGDHFVYTLVSPIREEYKAWLYGMDLII